MCSITQIVNANASKIAIVVYETILLKLFKQIWVLHIIRYGVVERIVVVIWCTGIKCCIFLTDGSHMCLLLLIYHFLKILSVLYRFLAFFLPFPILKLLWQLCFLHVILLLSILLKLLL